MNTLTKSRATPFTTSISIPPRNTATQRYQDIGEREDTYAETTDRYSNLTEAIGCMQHDVSLITPIDDQLNLV